MMLIITAIGLLALTSEPLFAKIYDIEPKESFLDLGPIVINESELKIKANEYLNIYGKKIGADGFILEKRKLEKVYLVNIDRDASWRKNKFKSAFVDAAVVALFLVNMGHGMMWPQSTYTFKPVESYRAIKFIKDVPKKVELERKTKDSTVIDYLNSLPDARDQLNKLHALFLSGNVDTQTYIELREEIMRKIV